MAIKKRRRSESFQDDNDDARKRLAAFHARMFEVPQEEAASAAPETPRVVFKAKHKKRKNRFAGGEDAEDGETVPMVKFNKNKNKTKKEKKTKKKTVEAVETANGSAVVKVPGGVKKQKVEAKNAVEKVEKKVQKQKQSVVTQKTVKAQTSAQVPQWHSMQSSEARDAEMDPLEQALGSMKQMHSKKVTKPPHKKLETVTGKAVVVSNTEKPPTILKETTSGAQPNADHGAGDGTTEHMTKKQKKRHRLKLKKLRMQPQAEASASEPTAEQQTAQTAAVPAANGSVTAAATVKKNVNESSSQKAAVASPKSPRSRKKRKRSPKAPTTPTSASPKTQTHFQPRQGKPLVLSDEPDNQLARKSKAQKVKTSPAHKGETSSKSTAQEAKKVGKKTPTSTKSLTPIAASLAKDAHKKNDMFVETQEQTPKAPKRVVKVAAPQVVHITDESSSESEADEDFDFEHTDGDNASIFSRLIDSAARERWELIEVGRLVRLFAAEWGMKASKTARFLNETCPELVSVDFLEGLGVNMSAKQLVGIFEAGSGNSGVLMNKMASAVENGHLSVRDPSFVSALERRVALMESNGEVMELLHPLLESLSTVRDVGCLLKQLCKHWQLERKIALVQQVLLSNVFDDLDGNQDEILIDLPDLTGRLDFPSRLDQEDVDENGNLKGFLANSDSEFSGDEGSEEEVEEEDSEVEEEPFEGESDSEEETEITGRRRGRHQFIEDEADVGEEDEEEEPEEGERRADADSSSSDSDSD
jgi:hypothetical protein